MQTTPKQLAQELKDHFHGVGGLAVATEMEPARELVRQMRQREELERLLRLPAARYGQLYQRAGLGDPDQSQVLRQVQDALPEFAQRPERNGG